MRRDERESLRRYYQFRCGYCGVHEFDVGAELTVDHFHPQSRGGVHNSTNWVYCCHACNEFKSDYWQPDSPRRLLHPLNDDVGAHLVEDEDGSLRARTETGAFHIEWLHLNRQQLVAYRRERRLLAAARQDQARLLERLKGLEERVAAVLVELTKIRNEDAGA